MGWGLCFVQVKPISVGMSIAKRSLPALTIAGKTPISFSTKRIDFFLAPDFFQFRLFNAFLIHCTGGYLINTEQSYYII